MKPKQQCQQCKKWSNNVTIIKKNDRWSFLFKGEDTKPKALCKGCRK